MNGRLIRFILKYKIRVVDKSVFVIGKYAFV